MKKTCLECKKEFETKDARRKYCSDACSGKAKKRQMNEASKRRHHRIMDSFRKTL